MGVMVHHAEVRGKNEPLSHFLTGSGCNGLARLHVLNAVNSGQWP